MARKQWFALVLLIVSCASTPRGRESAEAASTPNETAAERFDRANASGDDASPTSRLDSFERAILAAHNRVRSEVSPAPSTPLPPLEWSESLAELAREWASSCPEGHRPNNDVGENLYWSGGRALEAEDAVTSWAAEASYYDYASGVCNRGGNRSWAHCGHYTQLVWRNTRRLGCAARTDCPGRFGNVVVCNYDPPGNMNVSATRIPAPY